MSDVKVTVSAETSALNAGLASAKESVDSFKEHASESFREAGKEMLGAFAVTAVIEGVHSLMEHFSKVADMAARLGTTAESIQRIEHAAKASGSSLDVTAKGLEKVTYNAREALEGNGKLAEAFAALGINAEHFIDLSPQEKLLELAEATDRAEHSSAELGAAYRDVLGKAAGELLPMLKKGPEELKELFGEATVASDETVAALKRQEEAAASLFEKIKAYGATAFVALGDSVAVFWSVLRGVETTVLGIVSGALTIKEAFKAGGEQITDAWHRANSPGEGDSKGNSKKSNVEEMLAKAEGKDDKKAEREAEKEAGELLKVQSENVKKQAEAKFNLLELTEKQVRLTRELAALEGNQKNPLLTPLDAAKNHGVALDTKKALLEVEDKIAKEQGRKMAKLAKEQIREVIDAKKDELKAAEKEVSLLDKHHGPSVDSLRRIGGGAIGIDYTNAKQDTERQHLDYARQTVEQLRKAVDELEKANRNTTFDGGDTSYN